MTAQHSQRPFVVLMADDDPDDIALFSEALADNNFAPDFRSVSDGVELIQYLHHRGRYSEQQSPTPDLILLDLNMPRKNGIEALAEVKSSPDLSGIPIFILSTSGSERDHTRTAHLGAEGYLTKPNNNVAMAELIHSVRFYCNAATFQPNV
jgi:CheY-like chemotaxis protein